MTVFVVSLFLPYTVNFHLPRPGSPSTAGSGNDLYRRGSFSRQKSLAGCQSALPNKERESASRPSVERADKDNRRKGTVLVPSDPHAPEWGSRGAYLQPVAQTSMSPTAASLSLKTTPGLEGGLIKEPPVEHTPPKKASVQFEESCFSEAAWTIEPSALGNGGLKNAINSAVNDGYLGDKLWVGTLGMPTNALQDRVRNDISEKLSVDHDCLTVYVDDSDFDGHYLHFSKTILWPIFHYQIPDQPKSKAYEDHSWIYYVRVNQMFADRIVDNWKVGDIIWIHDYHLLLVPSMVREKLPDAEIGFFLHIAFPSSEVFRCLAVRKELLKGILGANLVGFQAAEYCHHFLQTCILLLNVEATSEGVQLEDRFVNVSTLPIGINPLSLEMRRQRPDVTKYIDELKNKYRGKHLIVARDKLDNIRGVRQKLLSYELFLNKYPKWRDSVVLLQVALTTTEQPELEATVSDIVSRVNSVHSSLAHQPLVFLRQDISFSEYIALITVSEALLVTSLREGMNLTSHEFIYCQDRKLSPENKNGALVLSEFTGSASVFGSYEFLVNPWNYHECADALNRILEMSPEEREMSWAPLHNVVMKQTSLNWVKQSIDALQDVWKEQATRNTISIPRLDMTELLKQYKPAKQRLFILDYEGTLTSWGSPGTTPVLTTPQRAISALNGLMEDPRNVVYVMSSRMPEELERLFRQVAGVGLIAENGCYIREFEPAKNGDNASLASASPGSAFPTPTGSTTPVFFSMAQESLGWQQLISDDKTKAWKDGVASMLTYVKDRTEGSWVEDLHSSLIFHYVNCEDRATAIRNASDFTANINGTCADIGIHAFNVEGVMVVAEPLEPNKTTAADMVYRRLVEKSGKPVDFLFVVGDGREDEPVFKWAHKLEAEAEAEAEAELGGKGKTPESIITVKLGAKNTEARATMNQGVTGVVSCLTKLAATTDREKDTPAASRSSGDGLVETEL